MAEGGVVSTTPSSSRRNIFQRAAGAIRSGAQRVRNFFRRRR
jgi:hypothetical protein